MGEGASLYHRGTQHIYRDREICGVCRKELVEKGRPR